MRGPPRDGGSLDAFARPLREDPATLELVVAEAGERGGGLAAASGARGDVVLLVGVGVLAGRGLAGGHARRHRDRDGLVVVGYSPIRVLHERAPADYAPRLRAAQYEAVCARYEREPDTVLAELWGGTVSMRREDCAALGEAVERFHEQESGLRLGAACREAGLRGVFDRSLRAERVYEPTLAEFVRESRAAGAHAAAVGRPPEAVGTTAPLLSAALQAVVLAAGSAHVWSVQDFAALRLDRLERRRGAIQAVRRSAAPRRY
ncbi:MAG TPA: hypothetical protein VHG69_13320, partial [Thermoleophilaceae bacterium]|nr:hypothetical protein [Thermoleophilaceae bacterium]